MTTTIIRRNAAKVAVAVLAFSGCSVSDILEIEDPDIINPSNVESAAGADAVRLGALARFTTATSGGESLFLLGGLFSDEWVNGDSFIDRQEIDQRVVNTRNSFLTDANRALHRARLGAQQAIDLLAKYSPAAPAYQVAEMYFVQAYLITMLGEHYCDGVVISQVVDGREDYGTPMSTQAAFEQALRLVDAGLALVTGTTANDQRVRGALAVTRGRILLNLNRPADAATAVAGVPTTFAYNIVHTVNTSTNQFWNFNNNARRYSVGNSEGTNGVNFATADDPRLPVCVGADTRCRSIGVTQAIRDDLTQPLHVQMLWSTRDVPVTILRGVDARTIEAEAQLRANNAAGALATLNAARTTVAGLTPLSDAGTAAARTAQLFRERAFWQFGRGMRTGDLRRLVRQYNVPATSAFPTGAWHKGGNYGTDVNVPVPQAEQNNPNVPSAQTCLNRNA